MSCNLVPYRGWGFIWHLGFLENWGKRVAMTNKEQELINQYPGSQAIIAMARDTWAGSKLSIKIELPVSDRLKEKLCELLGKNIDKIFFTDNDVRHIKNHHGQGEEKRGQVNIVPADLALIPVVLNEYDKVDNTDTDKLGNKKILFIKNIDNLIYVASVERGNNQIGVISLWKKK